MAAQSTSVLEALRPAVEAIDDLDWLSNEAPSALGEGSSFGDMLERASMEHEFCPPDARDQRDKNALRDGDNKPIGHYGKSFGGRWTEWVDDEEHPDHGYVRTFWSEKYEQTPNAVQIAPSERQGRAAEMLQNVTEVLNLMPARLRLVAVMQYEPRKHGMVMRHVFGKFVPIIALSRTARAAFDEARKGGHVKEATLYAWLEGLALRLKASKSRAGESAIIKAARSEMSRELSLALNVYEEARDRLPARWYPYQERARLASGGGDD